VPKERLMDVDWDTDKDQAFPVELYLFGEDRRNLLAEVAKAIADRDINILKTDMSSEGSLVRGTFRVLVKNLRQLDTVMNSMAKVKGVRGVVRKGEVVGE
jgi:GTP pyrophosphokinase